MIGHPKTTKLPPMPTPPFLILEKLIAKAFGIIIVGQAWEMLEGH
jgi:hypothetical protein